MARPQVTISAGEIMVLAGVCIGGYLVYSAWKRVSNITADRLVSDAAQMVDQRGTGTTLGQSQSWLDDTVRRGQEAGASTFVTSFFTGLFK